MSDARNEAPAVNAEDGYFDERVAARYDESSADMFALEVVEPVVDFLVIPKVAHAHGRPVAA